MQSQCTTKAIVPVECEDGSAAGIPSTRGGGGGGSRRKNTHRAPIEVCKHRVTTALSLSRIERKSCARARAAIRLLSLVTGLTGSESVVARYPRYPRTSRGLRFWQPWVRPFAVFVVLAVEGWRVVTQIGGGDRAARTTNEKGKTKEGERGRFAVAVAELRSSSPRGKTYPIERLSSLCRDPAAAA